MFLFGELGTIFDMFQDFEIPKPPRPAYPQELRTAANTEAKKDFTATEVENARIRYDDELRDYSALEKNWLAETSIMKNLMPMSSFMILWISASSESLLRGHPLGKLSTTPKCLSLYGCSYTKLV